MVAFVSKAKLVLIMALASLTVLSVCAANAYAAAYTEDEDGRHYDNITAVGVNSSKMLSDGYYLCFPYDPDSEPGEGDNWTPGVVQLVSATGGRFKTDYNVYDGVHSFDAEHYSQIGAFLYGGNNPQKSKGFISTNLAADNGARGAKFVVKYPRAAKLFEVGDSTGTGRLVDIEVTNTLLATNYNDKHANTTHSVIQFGDYFTRGFYNFNVNSFDQVFRFLDSSTGSPIPISGTMWVQQGSMDKGEGFAVAGGSGAQVSDDAPVLNKNFRNHESYVGNKVETAWSAVPGSFVYELTDVDATGDRYFGYMGIPAITGNSGDGHTIKVRNPEADLEDFPIGAKTSYTEFPNSPYRDYIDNSRESDVWSVLLDKFRAHSYAWRSAAVSRDMRGQTTLTVRHYSAGYRNWPLNTTYGVGTSAAAPSLDADIADPEQYNNYARTYFSIGFRSEVAFQPPAPTKAVDKNVAEIGETVTYTVKQQVNNRGNDAPADYVYESVLFEDTLPAGLTYTNNSFKVLDPKGNDVTARAGVLIQNGRYLKYTFKTDYLQNDGGMEYNGRMYSFTFKATVNSGMGGKLLKNTADVTFNGKYKGTTNEVVTRVPVKYQPTAKKVADGFTLKKDQFEFTLAPMAGTSGTTQVKKNDANGNVTFDELSYIEPGTYKYTIKETVGNDSSIVYDKHVYTLTVTIGKNGDDLTLATSHDGSQTFTNSSAEYPPPPSPKKSPDVQTITPLESARFTVTEAYPVVNENNRAESIVFYDVLSDCFDASKATVVASKGEWTKAVSGQRITLTAKDNAANLQAIQGTVSFDIVAPVKTGYDISTLSKGSDGLRYTTNTANIDITSRSGKEYKLKTNPVTVKIKPYEVSILKKTLSAHGGLVSGNSAYSLKGAVFEIHDPNGKLVGSVTTDAQGKGGPITVENPGTYTVVETKAPTGHGLSGANKSFSVPGTGTSTAVNVEVDNPALFATISAQKKDADYAGVGEFGDAIDRIAGTAEWQGDSPDFSGFSVKVEFFVGNEASGTPAASAVFKANKDGLVDVASSNASSGSWPYKVDGENVIPLGTVRVTEQNAPVGYNVNATPIVGRVIEKNGEAVVVWDN